MPLFLASLLGGLIQIAGSVAGRVMLALGFSFVVYGGVAQLLDWVKLQAIQSFGHLTGVALQIVGLLQVDRAVTVLFSALAARLLLNGLTSGAVAKWITKP